MLEEQVKSLLSDAFAERDDLFLIELKVSSDNAVKVIIDGDKGVTLQDCMFVSRAIEHNLDREEEDFSLQVHSSGATEPLVMPRQYHQHVGRELEVKTNDDETFQGRLDHISDNKVILKWKAREPKPIGKGKHTVQKEAVIALDNIKQAKVKIKF